MKIASGNIVNVIFSLSIIHVFLFTWLRFEVSIFKIVNTLLLLISIVLLIKYFFKLIIRKDLKLKRFSIPYKLLIIWSLFTIVRSLSSNFHELLIIIGNYNLGASAWLTPLALVFGYYVYFWRNSLIFFISTLYVAVLLTPFCLFSSVYFLRASVSVLFFSLPLFIFMFPLLKYKNKIVVVLGVLSYLILVSLIDYRTGMLVVGLSLFFATFEYFRNSVIKLNKKIFLILFLLFGLILSLINVENLIDSTVDNKNLTQDTRTFLLTELFEDLSINEQIIGRGTLGKYYSDTFEVLNENDLGIGDSLRGGVEVGFLNMILKGGFIMLILFLGILLPISLIGIFKSKNFICRSLGYYILLHLLLMSVNYPQVYDPTYLLLWMSAGAIVNKKFRSMTSVEIINLKLVNIK